MQGKWVSGFESIKRSQLIIPLSDTEQGTETFSGYEADFEVVATDISQKVESGNEQTGGNFHNIKSTDD